MPLLDASLSAPFSEGGEEEGRSLGPFCTHPVRLETYRRFPQEEFSAKSDETSVSLTSPGKKVALENKFRVGDRARERRRKHKPLQLPTWKPYFQERCLLASFPFHDIFCSGRKIKGRYSQKRAFRNKKKEAALKCETASWVGTALSYIPYISCRCRKEEARAQYLSTTPDQALLLHRRSGRHRGNVFLSSLPTFSLTFFHTKNPETRR